jgi:hypothetical protein
MKNRNWSRAVDYFRQTALISPPDSKPAVEGLLHALFRSGASDREVLAHIDSLRREAKEHGTDIRAHAAMALRESAQTQLAERLLEFSSPVR